MKVTTKVKAGGIRSISCCPAVFKPRTYSRCIFALLSGIALLLARPTLAQTPGAWSLAGDMSTPRVRSTLAVLPDGTVLEAGGATTSANADIYNPTTNTWSLTGPMTTARIYQAGTVLADGRVLVAGGQDANGNALASAEIYDPSTQMWTATGNMSAPRYMFTASLLLNGQVLVTGGYTAGTTITTNALTSSELWDPATGQWTATGNMANPHANQIAAVSPTVPFWSQAVRPLGTACWDGGLRAPPSSTTLRPAPGLLLRP